MTIRDSRARSSRNWLLIAAAAVVALIIIAWGLGFFDGREGPAPATTLPPATTPQPQ